MDDPGRWFANILVRRKDARSSKQMEFRRPVIPKFYNVSKMLSSLCNRWLLKLSHGNIKLALDYFHVLVPVLKNSQKKRSMMLLVTTVCASFVCPVEK